MQAPKSNLKKLSKNKLIGLEFENQLINSKTGFIIQKKEIVKLWKELSKTKKWKPTYDKYTNDLIGVTRKSKSGEIVVNTDTGVCLLELAMPPKKNLIEAEKEWKKEFNSIIKVAKKLGFTAIDLAATPRPIKGNTYKIKTGKGFYKLINDRIARHNLMIPIASHQACVDVEPENMIKAVNALIKIGGFLIALTANSVIENDQIMPWKETRTLHWNTPMCNKIKNWKKIFGGYPDKPYKNLSDYFINIWQATPLLVIKNGEWSKINDYKISVWQYLNSKKSLNGTTASNKPIKLKADIDDLNLLMILAWNDVKPHISIDTSKIDLNHFLNAIRNDQLDDYLKNKIQNSYLEVRMCPTGPKGEEMAFPALILGLISNLNKTIKFSDQITWNEGKELKHVLSIKGMDYVFKGKDIDKYLKDLVKIAEKGLKTRKMDEEKYLKVLYNRIKNKQTPADKTIKIFNREGIKGIIKKFTY